MAASDYDVAVVGGGLVGVATAWGLAREGCRVVVLDEGDRAVRASRGSLLYNGQLRIRSITLSIDDSGFEVAHRVECEAGGPGATQQLMVNQIGSASDTISAANGLAGSFS